MRFNVRSVVLASILVVNLVIGIGTGQAAGRLAPGSAAGRNDALAGVGHPGAPAAAGSLDVTFGTNGKVQTDFGATDHIRAVAIQPDGKIVAAGWTGPSAPALVPADFALARYNTDGSLDSTFGVDGKVTTDLGADEQIRGLAIQSDGKIVAAGWTGPTPNPGDVAVVRYLPDGTLDPTFGRPRDGGKVITDLGGQDGAYSVVIQADGKIVVAGFTRIDQSGAFAVLRYRSNGKLDPGFATAGVAVTDLGGNDAARSVAIQPDGKIVAFGQGGPGQDFGVVRYLPTGALDSTFGTAGMTITDFGAQEQGLSVALQADGKIVGAGPTQSATAGYEDFALARYEANGVLDPTFGSGGKVITRFDYLAQARAVAIQPDGKIVGVGWLHVDLTDFLVARWTPDGTLDTGFGQGGWSTTDFGCTDGARALAIQSDGRIVAAGMVTWTTDGNSIGDFGLARYMP